MPSLPRTLVLLPALALAPSLALAQAGAAERDDAPGTSERSIRLAIDNDLFAMRTGKAADHDYTHGTRIFISSAAAPAWMRRLAGDQPACRSDEARRTGCLASTFELAQEIYTPRIDGSQPVPGERPYSGWLFAAPGMHHLSEGRVRSFRLLVGVTGPASLAEKAQDGIHALLGEHERRGWQNQLRSEVGVALAYDDRFPLEWSLGGDRIGVLSLGWGAIVGNVRTALHVGGGARIGLAGDLRWSPEELDGSTPLRVYALGGVRQELVMRDLFVDGNTFHESVYADRIPAVREVLLGAGVRHDGYALEYRWVLRTREYEAQQRPHAWGSFAFILDW